MRKILCAVLMAGAVSASHGGTKSNAVGELPGESSEPPGETRDFVVGNLLYILLHEIGHAIIRDVDVPIFGLEENAADTIATMTLILVDQANPEREPRFSEHLAMAALGNVLLWQTGREESDREILYWAAHDLSIRRAARVACLLYGSDIDAFGWIVGATDMPEVRAESCQEEFELANHAVTWLVATYGVPGGGVRQSRTDQITIRYRNPSKVESRLPMKRLQEWRLIDNVADFLSDRFVLPDAAKIIVRECGSPNAYWDPDYRELIVC